MAVDDLAWIESLDLQWPALQRARWGLWLNVLVPGAGLVALQRERVGLPLTAAFLVFAEIALMGLLVMPNALGAALTTAVTVLAAGIWLASQVLLLRRVHDLQDLERQIRTAVQIEQAREAVLAAEWGPAKQLLAEAADYDVEQPELNWLLAKVSSAVARSDQAAKQWHRVHQVDRAGKYEQDITEALTAVPGRTSSGRG